MSQTSDRAGWPDDNQHTTDEVRIKLLVMVAIADGHWDRREVALVERMAARSGMSVAEVEALRDDPTFTMKELSQAIPQDNAGRIAFFADLVRVACADRDVHERELALLVRVGTALGFQADEVETIVEDAC